MLSHHRRPVHLSLMAFDLPVWSTVETAATLYQKDAERFHLLLTEPLVKNPVVDQCSPGPFAALPRETAVTVETPRLIWLELSPYRVIMTMQGNGRFSYRHLWERGVYGLSRYWLQDTSYTYTEQIRLRNFTRSLVLDRNPLPQHLRIEYELWSNNLPLGHYVLNLEIQHE